MSTPVKNMSGLKFGRLTVLENYTIINKVTKWECLCECGKQLFVAAGGLQSGKRKSCGCYLKDNPPFRKHGLDGSRINQIWYNMKTRCFNKNNGQYVDYGGRGITICEEWLDFMNFYNWAIANGYEDNLTIDRIDNDGNYEPGNCRWATTVEQAVNKRNNTTIFYKGKISRLTEICENQQRVYKVAQRIRRGWSAEKAIETP